MKKIAFLFLIYDVINQEELWYNYFKNIDKNKYTIYIHYKFDAPLKYFNEYKLKECIPTEYCKPSIVSAHNLLIKEALKDGNNYKFITLSQACIPLKHFDYIYNFLVSNDMSYFNSMSNDLELSENIDMASISLSCTRLNQLCKIFNSEHVYMSANWFILNNKLAKIVTENEDTFLDKFSNIFCPEEHYFIMMAYIYNCQNEIIIKKEPENCTTFTNWIYNKNYKYYEEYNYKSHKGGLKNYYSITNKEIDYLISSECLFGRKFNKNCVVMKKNPREYIDICDYLSKSLGLNS